MTEETRGNTGRYKKDKEEGKESTLKKKKKKGQIERDKASEMCKHLCTQNGK
jgi:hypothetical protein